MHGFPSSVHAVPFVFFASPGQLADVPGQLSATSHSPPAPRQIDVEDANVSAGQAAPVPVQLSATSQTSATGRQTLVDDAKPSAGQDVLVPVHVSVTSQTPAELRQTTPAFPAGCWHASLAPSHSSVEQGFPSSVHAVPAGFFTSAGQGWPGRPPHVSRMSHSPAAGRHSNVVGRKTSGGQVVVTPVHTSSGSQTSPEPGRQTVPVFPAGCWQSSLVPSH